MRNLKIQNVEKTQTILLPDGYTFTISEEETGEELTMADGSTVYENPGLRRVVEMEAGYILEADYYKLLRLRRSNPYVWLEYPDITGTTVSGVYSLEIGKRELFKFDAAGRPVFKGPSLTFTAREVE